MKQQKPKQGLTAEYCSCPHHYKAWTCIKCLKETQDEVKKQTALAIFKAIYKTARGNNIKLAKGIKVGTWDFDFGDFIELKRKYCGEAEIKKLEGK